MTPILIKFGEEDLYIDLGAEMPLGAEKDGQKIAVEIKSFLGKSPATELERAFGQFTLYRFLLGRKEADRILYLAVSDVIYGSVFSTIDARDLIVAMQIRLVLFYIEARRIVRWI